MENTTPRLWLWQRVVFFLSWQICTPPPPRSPGHSVTPTPPLSPCHPPQGVALFQPEFKGPRKNRAQRRGRSRWRSSASCLKAGGGPRPREPPSSLIWRPKTSNPRTRTFGSIKSERFLSLGERSKHWLRWSRDGRAMTAMSD
ncbi:uncharacterized protein J3R85_018759 [Psidium guajava]|nr:uncharacterized protein J3R85_018759 [Psidium guajava]